MHKLLQQMQAKFQLLTVRHIKHFPKEHSQEIGLIMMEE